MFRKFYIHEHHQPGKMPNSHPRGFTAVVSPSPMSERHVWLGIAWCSPKDEYNKRIGRETAEKCELKYVKKRDLPGLLSGAACIVYGENTSIESDYFWVLKYIV